MSRPLLSATFNFSNPESHKPDPLWPTDIAHWSQFAYEQLQNLTAIWPTLFQTELGQPPAELTYPMGGQFVVSRDRVLAHPLSFYKVPNFSLPVCANRVSFPALPSGLEGDPCPEPLTYLWSTLFRYGRLHLGDPTTECTSCSIHRRQKLYLRAPEEEQSSIHRPTTRS